MEIDPNFLWDRDGIYDTYDEIIDDIDETSGAEERPEFIDEPDYLDATAMGMAFALADEIAESERGQYDLSESTDEENMRLASLMTRAADNRETGKLRPFEQYIDDICRGRRKLFED